MPEDSPNQYRFDFAAPRFNIPARFFAYNPAGMNPPNTPDDLEIAARQMLEARKALDE